MNILLHVCCGPCSIYPVQTIRQNGHSVYGYFFNPNIHPFREFQLRLEALKKTSSQLNFDVEFDTKYGLRDYLRKVVFNEKKRCDICYKIRLISTVEKAIKLNFDAFSTTLLYSKYQNHYSIKKICESLSSEYQINFFYEDFRLGWQYGIDKSKEMELYRQPYCGCIYSEQERYDNSLKN